MRRRDFIKGIVGSAGAWPLAAHAQQADRIRRIGVLLVYSETDRENQARIVAFREALQTLGWTEGRNVRFEFRSSGGDFAREKAAVAELVTSAPDLIVATGSRALAEAQRLTSTIPIVFTQVSDPVGSGFVASLARPGSNITGFQMFETAIGGKWLGLLKEAAPNMHRVAVLFGSDLGAAGLGWLHAAEALAASLDIEVTPVDVSGGVEIERAITAFAGQPSGGLLVMPYPAIVADRAPIILLAARHRLPAIYPYRYFAAEGGLMSYGPDQVGQWREAAIYVDRILRGEKPSELPVQAPTKYELVINLKTAKIIGMDMPPALSLRADEVIE
jgi:putative tryptophan/tyrosine transport system substrate-binding protein